jgi:ribose transport system ATP-binding protein
MKGISKRFGGVAALSNVDITLHQGEVLGLIGENGAGKSTLIKILSGIVKKDAGTIQIGGENVDISDARQAQKFGIGVIFQELSVFQTLTAAQNIFINQELTGSPLKVIRQREMNRIAEKILKEDLGVLINPRTLAKNLSIGQRQSVEIARALVQKKRIIVMDEPTAALESKERESLYGVIARLKKAATSIIYISHHLDEVMRVCDRVIVLRDGNTVGEMSIEDTNVNHMIELMIGMPLNQQYPKEKILLGDSILEVKDLSLDRTLRKINFTLRKGEILGFAGLEGCGKNEILRCLFGIKSFKEGEVTLHGRRFNSKGILGAIRRKVAFLPAERKIEGLFLTRDVKWNATIASLEKISGVKINGKKENRVVDSFIRSLRIRVAKRSQLITGLSGGNQQKVMLARWLMTEPDIILMEEPTRGIDVSARTEVYRLITELAKAGKSICIVSPERSELLGMCDRIIIITEGEVAQVLDASKTTEKELAYWIAKSRSGDHA